MVRYLLNKVLEDFSQSLDALAITHSVQLIVRDWLKFVLKICSFLSASYNAVNYCITIFSLSVDVKILFDITTNIS